MKINNHEVMVRLIKREAERFPYLWNEFTEELIEYNNFAHICGNDILICSQKEKVNEIIQNMGRKYLIKYFKTGDKEYYFPFLFYPARQDGFSYKIAKWMGGGFYTESNKMNFICEHFKHDLYREAKLYQDNGSSFIKSIKETKEMTFYGSETKRTDKVLESIGDERNPCLINYTCRRCGTEFKIYLYFFKDWQGKRKITNEVHASQAYAYATGYGGGTPNPYPPGSPHAEEFTNCAKCENCENIFDVDELKAESIGLFKSRKTCPNCGEHSFKHPYGGKLTKENFSPAYYGEVKV